MFQFTPFRSVSTVCVLLGLLVYVFAILHRMMLGGLPDNPRDVHYKMNEYFGRIPVAMSTLFYAGTLGDSVWQIWLDIWQLGLEGDPKGYIFLGVFFLYVFLSMFTILNMLIGVLCEVVSLTSAQEKEEADVLQMKRHILVMLRAKDVDGK